MMTNPRYWPIFLVLCVGCSHNPDNPLAAAIGLSGVHYGTPNPQPQITGVVLAMGQSNMQCAMHPSQTPAIGFNQVFPGVTVINCAVGGTSIGSWGMDNLSSLCLTDWEATSTKPVIGIIWYQGESDAANGITSWGMLFTNLVAAWRMQWGNIPVVYAQLATHDNALFPSPTWELIKSQQADLRIPNSMMVKTDDLPRVDEVHLTGPASMVVGQRMAQAFNDLIQP
jgi:hypothetical protein